jgi:hypothetical protein
MRTVSRRGPLAAVLAALLSVALCSCTAAGGSAPQAPPVRPNVDCVSSVRTGLLPEWAQDDFLDGGASFRHVEGLDGSVVGVLFGYPLASPARADRSNKILWIAHDPVQGPLRIEAQLAGAGAVLERTVGFGGGQSIIDLPSPGCWRFTLHWGDHLTDVVDVPYVGASR